MKKITLIMIIFLLSKQYFAIAQNKVQQTRTNKIGLTVSSFGNNEVYRKDELAGEASTVGDKFMVFGINYVSGLNKWLELETGVEVAKYLFTITPMSPPAMEGTSSKTEASLINIPLTLRVNFLKYFFINGGIMLDVDVSGSNYIDDQTGIGAITGIAAKYDFKPGISIFVNPYGKFHSLIPFSALDNHQMLFENGFRFGITYILNKNK